ncbi:hypothetical protein F0U61_06910 [Archangium violaceum]|uniref:hypothetical protein n=1 Tax=Archangium violaceum TaxID=83451 RepID=UPI002B2C1A81|nr:hypothetical protein F0U61_06910 [Archangium violaceum]
MAVEMDFVVDLVNHLRAELVAAGFTDAADRAKVDDDEIGIRYFNVRVRNIDACPRVVKFSKVYASTVPVGQEQAIDELLAKVKRGDDLRPHQSRKLVNKKLLANDGMLNDWGIHHLHPDPAGGKDVLMCHVTAEALYAIGFWPHNKWTFKPIWDALIDSWPAEFAKYVMPGVVPLNLTDDERANLRAKNVSVFLDGPDGKVYRSMGGGLSTAGTNFSATTEYDKLSYLVQNIEEQVRQQTVKLGIKDHARFTLLFEDAEPVAIFDEINKRRIPLVES